MNAVVSRTDLARNTREIVEQVRRGETVIVQSYGEDQVVLLDALDYRLLHAAAIYSLKRDLPKTEGELDTVVWTYLDDRISLSKAAELLGISRFELMDRLQRLGFPLRLGPATLEEARSEVAAAALIEKPET